MHVDGELGDHDGGHQLVPDPHLQCERTHVQITELVWGEMYKVAADPDRAHLSRTMEEGSGALLGTVAGEEALYLWFTITFFRRYVLCICIFGYR